MSAWGAEGMNQLSEGYVKRINMIMRVDIKKAMDQLRAKRCRIVHSNVSLGRLFGEAALMLLESEGIPLSDAAPVVKRGPASTGRKRRETAVA